MKSLLRLLCLPLALVSLAHAKPASKESIENLLKLTKVESLVSTMYAQIDNAMRAAMDHATKGQPPSPETQLFQDAFRTKMVEYVKTELDWTKMKEMYIQIYEETFTQEEIDAMVAFYQTPAGQSMITKMPTVMQKSMSIMQQKMSPIMSNMQRLLSESMQEAKQKK